MQVKGLAKDHAAEKDKFKSGIQHHSFLTNDISAHHQCCIRMYHAFSHCLLTNK